MNTRFAFTFWVFVLCGLAVALWGTSANAHTGSTAYIEVTTSENAMSATWRLTLRDLDLLVDIDTNQDGTLTWPEVQAAADVVQALALRSLTFTTDSGSCALTAGAPEWIKSPEHDFAMVPLQGTCPGQAMQLRYSAFAGVDENHRALVHISTMSEPQVLAPGGSLVLAKKDAPDSFAQFYRQGIEHILSGIDHLLFLVALMLPSVLRREHGAWHARTDVRAALIQIIWLATAFTVAHSITLGLAAFDVLRFSPKVIEPLVAATVLAAALNNLRPVVTKHLAWIAFAFGLIHGFAFAEVLAPLHLSYVDMALALLGFNLGVETGQIAVIATCFVALVFLVRWRGYPRWVLQAGSAVVALLACAWIVERVFDVALIG